MPDIGASTTFTFKVDGLSSKTTVARFSAVEAISSLFELEVELTSEDKDIAFADVVGKAALLTLETDDVSPRHLHGIVQRFRQGEEGKKQSVYHATVVPKLWRLAHRHDARIFQAKKVPDILEAVLNGAGVTDYKLLTTGSYSPREYCVQYRESDFAFISRLMEEEGIFYFFEHTETKEILVLGDDPSAFAAIAGPTTLAYRSTLGAMAHGESVSRFSSAEEVRTGKVTLTDFNFKKPSLSLLESTTAKLDTDLEAYDYPGEYEVPADGTEYTKVRLQEHQARRAIAQGDSGCVRFVPGYTFTLSDHARDAANQQYLITGLRSTGAQAQMGEAGAGAHGPSFHNAFTAIPASVPFRPERVTPRPAVRGAQTAIVTGPSGEEIYTDEHGRVKVHFHWDRLGKKDDTSSCWIRVSQLWAGAGWGAMWIPRIGHEVIVDFLEGDPDRPIIVGRVYHGTNVPPYPLPADKTKSTIKSDSSKGGEGFNELRFEDKKSQEEIFLHAQKDWTIVTEHDKNQRVGNDETHSVGNDRTKHVAHDQQEHIDNDKSINVGGVHAEQIGKEQKITVGSDATYTVGGGMTESVAKDMSSSVGGALTQIVAKDTTITLQGDMVESITGALSQSVGKDAEITGSGDYKLSITKKMTATIGDDENRSVAKNQTITVGEKYALTVGQGTVTVAKNGDITIQGKSITITGTGPIQIKGSKIQMESDDSVDVKGSGAVKVKGSTVGIN